MITPFDETALQAFGYDVALSGEAMRLSPRWGRPLDPLDPPPIEAWDRHSFEPGAKILVQFGDLWLARSVERFDLPDRITMQMHNRSKYCRCGATPNAGLAPAEAGWRGFFVFELTCQQRAGVLYTVGERIAQALFFHSRIPAERPYNGSHTYQDQETIIGPRK